MTVFAGCLYKNAPGAIELEHKGSSRYVNIYKKTTWYSMCKMFEASSDYSHKMAKQTECKKC